MLLEKSRDYNTGLYYVLIILQGNLFIYFYFCKRKKASRRDLHLIWLSEHAGKRKKRRIISS